MKNKDIILVEAKAARAILDLFIESLGTDSQEDCIKKMAYAKNKIDNLQAYVLENKEVKEQARFECEKGEGYDILVEIFSSIEENENLDDIERCKMKIEEIETSIDKAKTVQDLSDIFQIMLEFGVYNDDATMSKVIDLIGHMISMDEFNTVKGSIRDILNSPKIWNVKSKGVVYSM